MKEVLLLLFGDEFRGVFLFDCEAKVLRVVFLPKFMLFMYN